jgi:hypothetical protein
MKFQVVLNDASSLEIELQQMAASPSDYMRMLTLPRDNHNGYVVTSKEGDCFFFDYDHVVIMKVVK